MKNIVAFFLASQRIGIIAALMLLVAIETNGQVVVSNGLKLTATGSLQLVMNDLDLEVNGELKTNDAAIRFTGGNNSYISADHCELIFNEFVIDKKNGRQVMLKHDITVTGKVNFLSGNIELNKQGIDLGSNGRFLNERENSRATGIAGGWIKSSAMMSAAAAVNVGNLGATVSSSGDMGIVTIWRKHQEINIPGAVGGSSINRSFEISTTNASPNSTCRFTYFDGELNGINENKLSQFKRNTAGQFVDWLYAARNPATNYVMQNGYSGLASIYTLSAPDHCLRPGVTTVTIPGQKINADQFTIMPNPVTDRAVVTINGQENDKALLVLFNAGGQQVMQWPLNPVTGIHQYPINLGTLIKGSYNLVLIRKNGVERTLQVIKL